MRATTRRVALAAALLAVLIGPGRAGAAESPCGDWGPYPPPVQQPIAHTQEGGRLAQLNFEDRFLRVEMWCVHESWFDGDNGGRGHFRLEIGSGPLACSAELDPERDTFVIDPELETASLRSFAPGCEARVDWVGNGITGLGIYAGAPDGDGSAGVAADLSSASADAGISQSRKATATGTMLGQAVPAAADSVLTLWQGRGFYAGLP